MPHACSKSVTPVVTSSLSSEKLGASTPPGALPIYLHSKATNGSSPGWEKLEKAAPKKARLNVKPESQSARVCSQWLPLLLCLRAALLFLWSLAGLTEGQSTALSTPSQTTPLLSYFTSGQVEKVQTVEFDTVVALVSGPAQRQQQKEEGRTLLRITQE